MKLHEVLSEPDVLSGNKWFVPADWIPCPCAFSVSDGIVHTVPGRNGGVSGVSAYVCALAGDWVIVDPSDILDYADKLRGMK